MELTGMGCNTADDSGGVILSESGVSIISFHSVSSADLFHSKFGVLFLKFVCCSYACATPSNVCSSNGLPIN